MTKLLHKLGSLTLPKIHRKILVCQGRTHRAQVLKDRAVVPMPVHQIWTKFGAISIASWVDCLDLLAVDPAAKAVVRAVNQEARAALVVDSTPIPVQPNWAWLPWPW